MTHWRPSVVVLPLAMVLLTEMARTHAQDMTTIVRSYCDNTINISRFDRPHQMRIKLDIDYPDPKPNGYLTWIEYYHWVSPPYYKLVAKTSEFIPAAGGAEVHTHLWNGVSEVNRYEKVGDESDQITISRRTATVDNARANRFLKLLGFPRRAAEREEAQTVAGWFPQGITEDHGYRLLPADESVDGVLCKVITCDGRDTLWFDCVDQSRPKLLKRDRWLSDSMTRRHVARYRGYREDGLPESIEEDTYHAVDSPGQKSSLSVSEKLRLTQLSFVESPRALFTFEVPVGASVLDITTTATIRVQEPGMPPFEKTVRNFARPINVTQSVRVPLIAATSALAALLYGMIVSRRLRTMA